MITRKVIYGFELFLIILITVFASTVAIYTNYDSDNTNGFTNGLRDGSAGPPIYTGNLNSIGAHNAYQIDAEAANAFGGAGGVAAYGVFQEWGNVAPAGANEPWPYLRAGRPGAGAGTNGITLTPGDWAQWDLFGPMSAAGADSYPEVNWGIYRMHLVIVTENPAANTWGPGITVQIRITIDTVIQYQALINSGVNSPDQTVVNDIWIDFHLNYGQNTAPTWLGQTWIADHTIRIDNLAGSINTLHIDEFHLTTE